MVLYAVWGYAGCPKTSATLPFFDHLFKLGLSGPPFNSDY